ncbi:hypothetical protein [Phytomonospora endophytica]|uniref:Uncharacterized protein n=1 Tax=Phytomonospora endophytica TaxID=714109 RepID=A0A841FKK2_9ACTN|nr:hypothetical protein [Phytomonospora endophytica]MBB6037861.1 hypothetical protein [Phytomonospora endophytica]GIG68760.1 hypothetical protein Pen01_50550 [Phytomonospora endophytica]
MVTRPYRPPLRALIALSVSAEASGEALARAIADNVRALPGTAGAVVAFIDHAPDDEKPDLVRRRFFVNLAWRPDDDTVGWSMDDVLIRDLAAKVIEANGGRLLSWVEVSLVLWRHLVAAVDGVVFSSPLPAGLFPAIDELRGQGRSPRLPLMALLMTLTAPPA